MADGINSFDPNLTNEGCPTWVSLPVGMDYKPMPSFRITVKANGSETIYEAPTLDECVALKVRSEPPTVLTLKDACQEDVESVLRMAERRFPDRNFIVIAEESLGRYIPPHPPSPVSPTELSPESRTFADTTYPAKAEWLGDGKDYAITPCGVSDGQGDSFSLIAKRFGVVVDKLAQQVAEGRFTPASNLSEEPAKHPEGWANFSEMKQSLADWNSAAINATISSFHLAGTAEKIIPFGPNSGEPADQPTIVE